MASEAESLDHLFRYRADLNVECNACGHKQILAIDHIVSIFVRRGWSTLWSKAQERFRCTDCNERDITLSANFFAYDARQLTVMAAPPVADEKLRPGLVPPPRGVSVRDWNRASDRVRKVLIFRARE